MKARIACRGHMTLSDKRKRITKILRNPRYAR